MKTSKLLLFLILLVSCFTLNSYSQFYVKIGAGYGFLPLGGFQYQESTGFPIVRSAPDSTGAITYKSFGMGIQPTLGFGYMITKNIALELNGSYLIGTPIEPALTNATGKWMSSGILISPAFRVQVPLKSVTPYTRMGLLIGIPMLKEEYTQTGTDGTVKFTTRGGVALGMDAGLGMDIKAGKKLNIFVELFGQALNWAPNELENTETFTGQTTQPLVTYTDSNRPYWPFGNFGGKVGVSILFGKMPKK